MNLVFMHMHVTFRARALHFETVAVCLFREHSKLLYLGAETTR